MKFRITGTFVAEFEPRPEYYPGVTDPLEMLRIDVQNYKDDPALFADEPVVIDAAVILEMDG